MRTDIDVNYILDLNRRFHDEVEADTYDARMGTEYDEVARFKMIAELESVLGHELPRGGRIVDVACGTGNVAVKLAQTGWFEEVVGVDISRKSLDIAKKNGRCAGSSITTMYSDMQTLPFEDNSMDMVVGCAFLHHLPSPDQFMCEVYRVLKPGAPFIIIGEPTAFGADAINVTKSPLVFMNAVLRKVRAGSENIFRWDHDNIDVHDFTKPDADMLVECFERPRVITQGFLEPIFDQGLFTPIRHVSKDNKLVQAVFQTLSSVFRFLDKTVFNHILPKFMRVSLKISGYKPQK